jgi:tRNA A-37 threonylcarbamoyl transferase component Bud32
MLECRHCRQKHPSSLQFCPLTGNVLAPERFLPVGSLLEGKYRVGEVIGAGGMGAVFEATHTMLDKRMAVKVMVPSFSTSQEMCARMVREARAASATGHRNIALVTDMGWTDEGSLFMVMERLHGRTLKELIASGRMPIARAADLLGQVLAGLDAVHRQGIVHRDLKPDNIMVVEEDGTEVAKILDFGISKLTADDGAKLDLTSTGYVMGTPQYMAPEQARGDPDLDHRADIYAAGAILYAAITGFRPHTGENYNQIIACIMQGQIRPPSSLRAEIGPALDRVLLKAMALEPERRYASARDFAAALRPFARGDASQAEASAAAGSVATSQDALAGGGAQVSHRELVALDAVAERPESASFLDLHPVDEEGVEIPSLPPLRPGLMLAEGDRSSAASPVVDADSAMSAAASQRQTRTSSAVRELALPAGSADEPPLVLAESPSTAAASRGTHTIHPIRGSAARRGRSRSVGWIVVLVLIATTIAVGVTYHRPVMDWFERQINPKKEHLLSSLPPTGDTIAVLVLTKPRNAQVVVDDSLMTTKSFKLPRSERTHRVEVRARGFRSRKLSIVANRSQTVDVVLNRER